MKNTLITIVMLLCCSTTASAQGIEIAFVLPSGAEQLSMNTAKMLRSKILPTMTAGGVETTEISTIAIKPEISFVDRQVLEGGMRKIHTSDIQFNFVCTNLVTGTTFASCIVTMRGEGFSDDEAVKNALSKLSSQDNRLANFIKTAKAKIIDYYQRNFSSIVSRAHAFANIQQYNEGLALLFSFPSTINGYDNINKEIVSIYRQYQTQECGSILQKARTEYANGNFEAAAGYLQQIEMTSSCATEAKGLCEKIKQSRDVQAKRAIELMEIQDQRNAEIEKLRIEAARDIVVAYFKRRTDVYFVW